MDQKITDEPLRWSDAISQAEAYRRTGADPGSDHLEPARALNCLSGPDLTRRLPTPSTGALSGVPFLLKDLVDLRGTVTRAGSAATLEAAPASTQDAQVDRFENIGLRIIGKTATSEFGLLPSTEPLAGGPTRNPWDTTRTTGGSSGGAAAAVAAGIIPIAHATDGGGSLRIPASCCGLFGLKPSRGRLIGASQDTRHSNLAVSHILSRTVRDSALVLDLTLATPTVAHPTSTSGVGQRLKIGVINRDLRGCRPDRTVAVALEDARALVESLGHRTVEVAWPVDDRFFSDFELLWASMAAAAVARTEAQVGTAEARRLLEPFTLEFAGHLKEWTSVARDDAHARLSAAAAGHDAWLAAESVDIVLSPVVGHETPHLGWLAPDVPFGTLIERLRAFVSWTPYHNVTGAPAMSVPLWWSPGGLPIGAQFTAPRNAEALLLRLAAELEVARPWAWRWPSLRE